MRRSSPVRPAEAVLRVEQMAPAEAVGEVPPELHIEPDIYTGLPENEGAADAEPARPDESPSNLSSPNPRANRRLSRLPAVTLAPSGEPAEDQSELRSRETRSPRFQNSPPMNRRQRPCRSRSLLPSLSRTSPNGWHLPMCDPSRRRRSKRPSLKPGTANSETMDAPPAEPPLRDRIPSVLPVELEAIKTPLAVRYSSHRSRPPQQPAGSLLSRAPETAVAAAAVAVPRDTLAVPTSGPSTEDLKRSSTERCGWPARWPSPSAVSCWC